MKKQRAIKDRALLDKDKAQCNSSEKHTAVNAFKDDKVFLTEFDCEVLENMKTWFNKPFDLCVMSAPALVCLLLCSLLRYAYSPYLVQCMWPHLAVKPNINSAVTCFLVPAGLVYALTFGFMFQMCMEKQQAILNKVTREIAVIDHIITIAAKLNLPYKQNLLDIYR